MNQLVIDSLDFVASVNKLINDKDFSNILIVTGKSFEQKIKKLKIISKKKPRIFISKGPYPKVSCIYELIKLLQIEKPDLIIAIGGGRTIDIVKQANKLYELKSKEEIIDCIKNKTYADLLCLSSVLVIPTTAGTGSEATQFAVTYIDNKKYSVDHKDLLPEFVIHDSTLLRNMDKNIIASTAMDALTQAIESIWAIKSSKESTNYAAESIKLIRQNVITAYESRNNDKSSSKKMQTAAYLSGKAINISRTTAPHAISYPLTVHFNISHGHAVAMILRHFIRINSKADVYEVIDPRGKDHVKKTMNEIISLFECDSIEDCCKKFDLILEKLSLEINFKKMGIENNSDIEKIVQEINLERLNNNPVKVSKDDIKNIFRTFV